VSVLKLLQNWFSDDCVLWLEAVILRQGSLTWGRDRLQASAQRSNIVSQHFVGPTMLERLSSHVGPIFSCCCWSDACSWLNAQLILPFNNYWGVSQQYCNVQPGLENRVFIETGGFNLMSCFVWFDWRLPNGFLIFLVFSVPISHTSFTLVFTRLSHCKLRKARWRELERRGSRHVESKSLQDGIGGLFL